MKKIRIGLIVIATILLTWNFIILSNNNWNSTKISSLLFAISIIFVITNSIISLIQETKKRKSFTNKEKDNI
jgi:uncharacterized membrane protein